MPKWDPRCPPRAWPPFARGGGAQPATPNTPPPQREPVDMLPSRFRQFVVPWFFAGVDPPLIAEATNAPLRVHVRNIGPNALIISDVINDLSNPGGPTGAVVRLPAGERDVWYLAPKQKLYALAAGPGGLASVGISDELFGA